MNRIFALATLSLILLCGCSNHQDGLVRTSADGKSQIIQASANDARLAAATDEARRRVPEFVKLIQSPTPQSKFMLKIPVTDGKNTEYMWITDVKYNSGTFTGTFIDDAFDVAGNFKKGQPATCPESAISDWIYTDGKNTVGGFTTKILEEMAAKNPNNPK